MGVVHAVSASTSSARSSQRRDGRRPVVILRIDTPGGLLTATYQINETILASRVPVRGLRRTRRRACHLGRLHHRDHADVVAMAPGTNMGAAHPVSIMGGTDETMAKKGASDVAAFVRGKAEQRGRNVELAEKAVLESRSFTDKEALEAHLSDLIVEDVPELLTALDGREVKRFDGRW